MTGALRAVVDVLDMLAAAAVAIQVIVLGASVFLPSLPTSSPKTTLQPLKRPQTPLLTQSIATVGLPTLRGPTILPAGVAALPAGTAALPRSSARASFRINQNLLQVLLPSDKGDRKVSAVELPVVEALLPVLVWHFGQACV